MPGVEPVTLEVTDDDSVTRCVGEIIERAGRIDVVVYSAGFMSSSAAVAAIPFHAFYSASKAALEHYADALRYEVAPFGVRVTCIQGTSVRTGAAAAARSAAPSITAYDPVRTRVIGRFQQTQRQGPAPTAFAAAIVHATETRRLRPHYRVGAMAKTLPLLRHLLPDPIFRPSSAEPSTSRGHRGDHQDPRQDGRPSTAGRFAIRRIAHVASRLPDATLRRSVAEFGSAAGPVSEPFIEADDIADVAGRCAHGPAPCLQAL